LILIRPAKVETTEQLSIAFFMETSFWISQASGEKQIFLNSLIVFLIMLLELRIEADIRRSWYSWSGVCGDLGTSKIEI